jgi:small-conductance mechanosensitive channel
MLPFDTLALLAKGPNGGIDQDKAKLLIRVFRPDREGKLGKLDFVKSVDHIYKEIKLLSANVANSSQIDTAVKGIVNIGFYIILGAICLAQLGVNPLQLFISFSGIILGFAFMFGSSAAKMFEVSSPLGRQQSIPDNRPDI